MKTYVQFTLYSRLEKEVEDNGKIRKEDYGRFKALFPQFLVTKGRERLEFKLPRPSLELTRVEDLLRAVGLELYVKRRPHHAALRDPKLVRTTIAHEFSLDEYEQAPFLTIMGAEKTGVHKELYFESPVLIELESRIPPIGWTDGQTGPICTDSVKKEIEACGFVGFVFTPVSTEASRQPPEALWEIWSNQFMPPMSVNLVDDDGRPVLTSDFSNGCYTAEIEDPPLYMYTADDLAVMQSADAALTHEDFGPKTKLTEMRRLLVSQRFRRWALERKYQLVHVPVMVDGSRKR